MEPAAARSAFEALASGDPWWIVPILSVALWLVVERSSHGDRSGGDRSAGDRSAGDRAAHWERLVARALVPLTLGLAWMAAPERAVLDLEGIETAYVATWQALDRKAESLTRSLAEIAETPPAGGRLGLFELLAREPTDAAEPPGGVT